MYMYMQLTTVMTQALMADDIRVITERLTFTGEVDDPAGVVQQLNV